MISFISDVHNIMRDSLVCKTTHARASQAQLNTTNQKWKESIVLSSRWHSCTTRSTSVYSAEAAQLTISVAQWLPTVFVILWLETPIAIFFTMASIIFFWIEPCVAIFSIPSVASPGVLIGLDWTCQRLFCPFPRRRGICFNNDIRRSKCVLSSQCPPSSATGRPTNWNFFLRYDMSHLPGSCTGAYSSCRTAV